MSKKSSSTQYTSSFQEQFTMRGVIIGIIGAMVGGEGVVGVIIALVIAVQVLGA